MKLSSTTHKTRFEVLPPNLGRTKQGEARNVIGLTASYPSVDDQGRNAYLRGLALRIIRGIKQRVLLELGSLAMLSCAPSQGDEHEHDKGFRGLRKQQLSG